VVHSLIKRAIILCTEKQDCQKSSEDLTRSGHEWVLSHLIDSVLKRSGAKRRRETDETRQSTAVIPYVKGISERFRCIGERYNIKAVFKTRQTLRSFLTRTRPHREVQDMRQCIYSIPCECGRCYIGETGRPLGVRTRTYEQLKTGTDREIQVS
jgi:hypothetical protein